MSDQSNGDAPRQDRATVAMVLRAVDDLKALTDANLRTVETKIDGLHGLVSRVEKVENEQRALSVSFIAMRDALDRHLKDSLERVQAVEDRNRFWRRSSPSLVIALLALLMTAAQFLF